jgi:hypothetical protein
MHGVLKAAKLAALTAMISLLFEGSSAQAYPKLGGPAIPAVEKPAPPVLLAARRHRRGGGGAVKKKPVAAKKPTPAKKSTPAKPEGGGEPARATPPSEEPAMGGAQPPGGGGDTGALQRGARVEFDGRLVQGQTAKSGAIYLFARKRSQPRSMVKERVSYQREILRTVYPDYYEVQ